MFSTSAFSIGLAHDLPFLDFPDNSGYHCAYAPSWQLESTLPRLQWQNFAFTDLRSSPPNDAAPIIAQPSTVQPTTSSKVVVVEDIEQRSLAELIGNHWITSGSEFDRPSYDLNQASLAHSANAQRATTINSEAATPTEHAIAEFASNDELQSPDTACAATNCPEFALAAKTIANPAPLVAAIQSACSLASQQLEQINSGSLAKQIVIAVTTLRIASNRAVPAQFSPSPASSAPLALSSPSSYCRLSVEDFLDELSVVRDWRSNTLERQHRYQLVPTAVDSTIAMGSTADSSQELAVAVPDYPQAQPHAAAFQSPRYPSGASESDRACYPNDFDFNAAPVLERLLTSLSQQQAIAQNWLSGCFVGQEIGMNLSYLYRQLENVATDAISHAVRVCCQSTQQKQDINSVAIEPLFVIYELEGKEFLLPARQAMIWHHVPKLLSSNKKIATAAPSWQLPPSTQPTPADVAGSSHLADQLTKVLAYESSRRLDSIAITLQKLASSLRSLSTEAPQVANKGDDTDVR